MCRERPTLIIAREGEKEREGKEGRKEGRKEERKRKFLFHASHSSVNPTGQGCRCLKTISAGKNILSI